MGIDNRKIFATAMGIALAVAALAGLFLGIRANFDPTIGPSRLIFAFEAVIIGGLGSLWGTLAGGIVIGIAQTAGRRSTRNGRSSPAISPSSPCWSSARAACSRARRTERRCPTRSNTRPEPRRRAATASPPTPAPRASPPSPRSAIVAVLFAVPFFAGRALIQDLFFLLTMLCLAQYWNLLAGFAGLVSVGQQAFVGLGAYLLFAFVILWGLDPIVSIVLSGFVTALVALPTAFIVFRLRGPYFAIGTWVVAEVFRLLLAQFKSLGGGTGTSLPRAATNDFFAVTEVAELLGLRWPRRATSSPTGWR